MKRLYALLLTLFQDEQAQDIVEYSLLAGFLAVAAGAILPPVSDNISIIFSKMASVTAKGAAQ